MTILVVLWIICWRGRKPRGQT